MTDYTGILFGIENPLLDITANVQAEMVSRYDAQFGNSILASEKQLPVYKELTDNYDVEYSAGGATLNVMRVFQWMLQKGPNCASYVGCIGNDKFGEEMRKAAEKAGVKANFKVDPDTPTGTCACLVVGKERSLIANLGAANKYTIDHLLLEPTQALIKQSQFIYSSGFFLTVSPDSQLHCAQHCAENNKVFMTNLSALFIINFFKDPLLKVLPYADYLFGNEDEAREFAKMMGWETTDVSQIAALCAKLPKENKKRPRTVVFTQGEKPVVVAVSNGEQVQNFTFEVPLIPKEKLVDTNGAGDSFVGGFLSRLVQGKELEACVKAGNYAAGVVIQHSGCTFPEKPDFE